MCVGELLTINFDKTITKNLQLQKFAVSLHCQRKRMARWQGDADKLTALWKYCVSPSSSDRVKYVLGRGEMLCEMLKVLGHIDKSPRGGVSGSCGVIPYPLTGWIMSTPWGSCSPWNVAELSHRCVVSWAAGATVHGDECTVIVIDNRER